MNRAIRRLGAALIVLMLALIGQLTYLQLVHADTLNHARGNLRLQLFEIAKPRGRILTADGVLLARSVPVDDTYRFARQYPFGSQYAQFTGYQSILYGNSGLEASYDRYLNGKDVEIRNGGITTIIPGHPTGDLHLTVSSAAQTAAIKALGSRRGSVVVLDVQTGGVVAMYSNPSYDPTWLSSHNTKAVAAIWAALQNSADQPMLARAYRERYPPGSTFKVVTTAVGLATGQYTIDSTFAYRRSYTPALTTHSIANFGNSSCGGSLKQSFVVSCNSTFAEMGEHLGEALAEGDVGFGFGERPPLDLVPAAAHSTGPKAGTAKADPGGFALAGIGQQDVAATPLQMALVAEAVATGGTILTPHVVDSITRSGSTQFVLRTEPKPWLTATTPAIAATLKDFMIGVVERGTGTAAQLPGIQVAGKTGTAQTVKGVAPHVWFIGFAPAQQPRYAIAVIVERGGDMGSEATGGHVAAPIARDVFATLLGTGGAAHG